MIAVIFLSGDAPQQRTNDAIPGRNYDLAMLTYRTLVRPLPTDFKMKVETCSFSGYKICELVVVLSSMRRDYAKLTTRYRDSFLDPGKVRSSSLLSYIC